MFVKPFKGLRPVREYVNLVAAKPYDVVTTVEARKIAVENDKTFYRVTRPEINFDEDVSQNDDRVILKGREVLDSFVENNIMKYDSKPSFYVYKETWNGKSQLGIYATVSVNDYVNGHIKKHELTRRDKEDERAKHVYLMRSHNGPVFLMYKSLREVNEALEKHSVGVPEYDFTDENGVTHELWVVNHEDDVKEITEVFTKVGNFYIADGHHRAAAAARAREMFRNENPNHTGNEEYNYFLAAIFPHDQLTILDYNRVVRDLNLLSENQFYDRVSESFFIEEKGRDYKPAEKHKFGMYINGEWLGLTPKNGTFDEDDVIGSLDVSILQGNLLAPILGIGDPRTDKRIDFVGGIKGTGELERLVNSGEYKVAFSLYPTSVSDLIMVADENKIMPPKSTWFEPKLKSGLVVHTI
jgi:uncharacterized protein (DUF1015 family)